MPFISRVGGSYQSDSSAKKREVIRRLSSGGGNGGGGGSGTFTVTSASLTVTTPENTTINQNDTAPVSMGDFNFNFPNSSNFNPGLTWSFGTLPTGIFVRNYRILLEDLSFTDPDTNQAAVHWDITVPSTVTSINSSCTSQVNCNSSSLWTTRIAQIKSIYIDTAQKKNSNEYVNDSGSENMPSVLGYAGPNPPPNEIHTYRLSVTANLCDGTTTNRKITISRNFRFGSGTVTSANGVVKEPDNLTFAYSITAFTPITMSLTSTAFVNEGTIPNENAFPGVSPQLTWTPSAGTTSLISTWRIIMMDMSGGIGTRIWTHWRVENIPANITTAVQNITWPAGQGINVFTNSLGSAGYAGPMGSSLPYYFTVIGYDSNGNEVPGASATLKGNR